jgi:hypothetical protein
MLTFGDGEALAIRMHPAPDDALLWRPELAGRLDRSVRARRASFSARSTLRGATIRSSRAALRAGAVSRPEPALSCYRAAAAAHPDLDAAFKYAIQRLLVVRRVMVLGDFVGKNMFLLPDGLCVLDHEVAHFGNPGYDVATFVNNMLLKRARPARAPARVR